MRSPAARRRQRPANGRHRRLDARGAPPEGKQRPGSPVQAGGDIREGSRDLPEVAATWRSSPHAPRLPEGREPLNPG